MKFVTNQYIRLNGQRIKPGSEVNIDLDKYPNLRKCIDEKATKELDSKSKSSSGSNKKSN